MNFFCRFLQQTGSNKYFLNLQIVAKITHPVNEEIDKILGNKPARQPMISTLQTRWAATGGVPPC